MSSLAIATGKRRWRRSAIRRLGGGVVHREPHDDKAAGAAADLHRAQLRHAGPARGASGRPEVEDDRAAPQFVEAHGPAIEGPNGEGPHRAAGWLGRGEEPPPEDRSRAGDHQHQGDDEASQPVLPFTWSREAGPRANRSDLWMPQPGDFPLSESRDARERRVLCMHLNMSRTGLASRDGSDMWSRPAVGAASGRTRARFHHLATPFRDAVRARSAS